MRIRFSTLKTQAFQRIYTDASSGRAHGCAEYPQRSEGMHTRSYILQMKHDFTFSLHLSKSMKTHTLVLMQHAHVNMYAHALHLHEHDCLYRH
jgi:hypothetical protein